MCRSLCKRGELLDAFFVTSSLNKSRQPFSLKKELSDWLNLCFQVDKPAIVQFKVKRGYHETHNKKTEGIPTVHDYAVMLNHITKATIERAKRGGPVMKGRTL